MIAAAPPERAGILNLGPGQLWGKRIGLGLSFSLVTLGSLAAFYLIARDGAGVLWIGLPIFLVFYSLEMIGVTVGCHRYFSHQSFECSRPVKVFLIVTGSVAMGSVLDWAADHRRHHRFSDLPGDVHSPFKFEGRGARVWLRNFLHAHIGWLFDREKTDYRMYIPDLLKDSLTVKIERLYLLYVFASYFLSALAGAGLAWLLGQTGIAGDAFARMNPALVGFLWGGCLAPAGVMTTNMSLNSICHLFGPRPFETGDNSVNNRLVAFSGFGEGWHNNHHAFPFSARFGVLPGQIDFGFYFIRLLERLGLAWKVKQPSAEQLQRKRRQ